MSSCPACGASLQEDFGLVNCPACGKASFIDMEGNVTLEGAEGQASPGSQDGRASEVEDAVDGQENSPESLKEEFSQVLVSELTGLNQANDLTSDSNAEEEPLPDEFQHGEQFSSEYSQDFNDEGFQAADLPTLGEGEKEGSEKNQKPSHSLEDMSELASFGNSSNSSSLEGRLRYCLYISGVDTAEIKRDLKDSLMDRRFLWDIDAILSQVQNGELKIDGVSSVKAALIVSRIKNLPVEIRWEQYEIHSRQM